MSTETSLDHCRQIITFVENLEKSTLSISTVRKNVTSGTLSTTVTIILSITCYNGTEPFSAKMTA